MTEDRGQKKKKGVACFFRHLEVEQVCLHFADLFDPSEEKVEQYVLTEPFISKNYKIEQLLNDKISKSELAAIGQIILIRSFAHLQPKIDRTALLNEIQRNFANVEFPTHLGLKAAEAIDEWVTDKKTLALLTKEKDFHGPWWEVPNSHLREGSLGLNYLDSKGFIFYLPAYMSLAIKEPSYVNFYSLISELNPIYEGEYVDLYVHFCQKLSLLDKAQRQSVKNFMRFMTEELMLMIPLPTGEISDLYKSLNHEYWQD